jgi:hypothetical protein
MADHAVFTAVNLQDGQPISINIQSTSEIRTVVGFRIRFYASTGHLKTGLFDNWTKKSGFQRASLDCFIKKRVIQNILFFYSFYSFILLLWGHAT